jgi:hypothetical protein
MSLSVALCITGYVVAGAVALWLAQLEYFIQRSRRDTLRRPQFWVFGSALLVTMAVGRSLHIGNLLGEYGRHTARHGGWYEGRRTWQEAAVFTIAALGVAWMTAMFVTLVRAPDKRRYVPTAIVVGWLACFNAIRVVSLHQVDVAVDQPTLWGAKAGIVAEIAILVVTLVAMLLAGSSIARSAHDHAGAVAPARE